jgi:GNAT superfamily N-acetyltransferase|uniref:Acetyltransferase domain containing protein n=1 Tax=Siphoviridae sp. ctksc2 TaxID=2825645 RepID=A0A8S5US74_9CAUD|nr:MAG TPA: acetyltransferase domain containing protein [Siphoviridae sp. ctksc2]
MPTYTRAIGTDRKEPVMEITTSHYSEDDLPGTRYSMIDDGEEVGYLIAHTTGLILNVEVDEDRQGEGIARALFEYADDAQGLYHIPSWGRTEDGDRFANAMGGDTMDDEQAAAIVGMDLSIYDVD